MSAPTTSAIPARPVAARAPSSPAMASSAVADVLTGPRRAVHVVAAFPAAVYLEHDDGIVTLVAADGIHHPNALVLTVPSAGRPLAGAHPGQRGTVGRGVVELGQLTVTITRWFDPAPRLPATRGDALAASAAELEALVLGRCGPLPTPLAAPAAGVAAALGAGATTAAVEAAHRLVGNGPGLTPAGDDILAGLLATVRLLAPVVTRPGAAPPPAAAGALTTTLDRVAPLVLERARVATTTISAELLRHAVRGELAAPATGVLQASTGRRALGPALDRLLAVGATSGRDLAHGIILGTHLVAATPQVALRPPEPVGDVR